MYVTDNPPLICLKNNKLDCIAGTLVKNAAKQGGFAINVTEVPWARAQVDFSKVENGIFISTGRNEFTENKYNWYFQIYSDDVFIFTLGSLKIKSDKDLKKLKSIGLRIGSPFFDYVNKKGLGSKIYEVRDWVHMSKMLKKSRIDAMCLTGLIGRTNIINLAGIKNSELNTFKVGEMSWYIIMPKEKKLNKDLIYFKDLLKLEKDKPYFQEMLTKYQVRN